MYSVPFNSICPRTPVFLIVRQQVSFYLQEKGKQNFEARLKYSLWIRRVSAKTQIVLDRSVSHDITSPSFLPNFIALSICSFQFASSDHRRCPIYTRENAHNSRYDLPSHSLSATPTFVVIHFDLSSFVTPLRIAAWATVNGNLHETRLSYPAMPTVHCNVEIFVAWQLRRFLLATKTVPYPLHTHYRQELYVNTVSPRTMNVWINRIFLGFLDVDNCQWRGDNIK